MDITSIIKAVLTHGEDKPGREVTDWQPGDRLTGRVLRLESDGKVLMDLGGSRALARVGFPVRAGQVLPLEVVENEAVLHLQVEPASTGRKMPVSLPKSDFSRVLQPSEQERLAGMVRRLTVPTSAAGSPKNELPEGVKSALTRILTLFEPVPVEAAPQKISQWIKGAVEDRGMLLEKKLAETAGTDRAPTRPESEKSAPVPPPRIIITKDVKSQLLMLRRLLPSSDEPTQTLLTEKLNIKSAAFLRQTVDRLLGHIESQQERAVARWADGETQQIFIHTLALQDPKSPVQLKIYYPAKQGRSGGSGQHRIALLLDMDRLGPVRIDLAMQDRMLQIIFYVGHQKALDLMKPEVESVSRALAGFFDHVSIDLLISKQKIVNFDTEDGKGPERGRIDLTI